MSEPEATVLSEAGKGTGKRGGVCLAVLLVALASVCVPILFGAIVLGIVTGLAQGGGYPSSDDMVSRYMNNKTDFELLARMMLEEEEITAVYGDECELRDGRRIDGVEHERCRALVELCSQLGIERAGGAPWHLVLEVGSWGGAMGGSIIGYEYLSQPPPPLMLVDDINHPGEELAGQDLYQHIEGNWYIFLCDN
jgi:hypothetical protein